MTRITLGAALAVAICVAALISATTDRQLVKPLTTTSIESQNQ